MKLYGQKALYSDLLCTTNENSLPMTPARNKLMGSKNIRIASYNCKNVKRSIDDVKTLCQMCDIIALQETWLLPEELPFRGSINGDFGYAGVSAVDSGAGMLRGRAHGGVALVWRRSVMRDVTIVQCDNPRICAIKIVDSGRSVLVFSVYMPSDAAHNLTEFTHCIGTVSAIIDSCCVEDVFIAGDWNSHPGEPFYHELMNFCDDNEWTCIDIEQLGLTSGTFTFISDAHGSTRWLDHVIVTKSAIGLVDNVYVKYDSLCSDHFPLILDCNFNVIRPKIKNYNNESCINKNIVWGNRTSDEIKLYREECHKRLRNIDFPMDVSNCCDRRCNEPKHEKIIDSLYNAVVTALSQASIASREPGRARRKLKRVVGWNRHVSDVHREARSSFETWVLYGKPTMGVIYESMRESRKVFKSKLRITRTKSKWICLPNITLSMTFVLFGKVQIIRTLNLASLRAWAVSVAKNK
jgi:exonuclease III